MYFVYKFFRRRSGAKKPRRSGGAYCRAGPARRLLGGLVPKIPSARVMMLPVLLIILMLGASIAIAAFGLRSRRRFLAITPLLFAEAIFRLVAIVAGGAGRRAEVAGRPG